MSRISIAIEGLMLELGRLGWSWLPGYCLAQLYHRRGDEGLSSSAIKLREKIRQENCGNPRLGHLAMGA